MCNTDYLTEVLGRGVKARKHCLVGTETSVWAHALNNQKFQAVTEELYS